MTHMRPSAVLLDFYGTVVAEDDVPLREICKRVSEQSTLGASVEEIASLWGRLFTQFCHRSHGSSFRSQKELEVLSLERTLRHFKANLDAEELSTVLFEYWSHPPIFPESRDVLARCTVPICLLTNIDNAELHSALEYHGLDFEYKVTSEDCKAYKPRRETFQRALSLLGLPKTKVLHVGDSFSNDVCGAQQLGIPVLWVNRKKRSTPEGKLRPDHVAEDLTKLLDVLQEPETAARKRPR